MRGWGIQSIFEKKKNQNKAHDGANRFIPSRTGAPVKDKKRAKNAKYIYPECANYRDALFGTPPHLNRRKYQTVIIICSCV